MGAFRISGRSSGSQEYPDADLFLYISIVDIVDITQVANQVSFPPCITTMSEFKAWYWNVGSAECAGSRESFISLIFDFMQIFTTLLVHSAV